MELNQELRSQTKSQLKSELIGELVGGLTGDLISGLISELISELIIELVSRPSRGASGEPNSEFDRKISSKQKSGITNQSINNYEWLRSGS